MHNDFIELYVGNIFFIYFKAPRTVEPLIIDNYSLYLKVMKFGNHNQIACIAEEVGGVVEAAPEEAQVELFDALIDGCRESVETEDFESKVKHLNCEALFFFGSTEIISPIFHVCYAGSCVGFLWCASKSKRTVETCGRTQALIKAY